MAYLVLNFSVGWDRKQVWGGSRITEASSIIGYSGGGAGNKEAK